jgi:hypothetical protein
VTHARVPVPNAGRRPGRVVIAVILVVLARVPASQVVPAIEGLIGLVALAAAWDVISTRICA